MAHTLENQRVQDLSTEELKAALEWRLVQEGLEDATAGRTQEMNAEYFQNLRKRIDTMATRAA